ncbi:DUF2807 domain-containing protein [Chitinophaga pendula]|uniref:head GIN domain-containing protein n=1 Tax=Chitinophaga TaxID=79328 RepID=UPI000BAEE59B|nr:MULTISPECIES: head GIN domain-containing protein [Chitinophaga]ASZ14580.1 hypothetical protein CK934_28320 [Chitinophaga sp. MD30]UCJ07768.1 DUF2807 domain-containing protein [Chitinophaga pendula]
MKKIMCLSSAIMVGALLLSSCHVSGQRVNGSGNVAKEERQVGEFDGVILRGSMDVYVQQGTAKAAVIEAEDNIIPYIQLDNRGGMLTVDVRKGVNLRTHKGIKIYLTTSTINKAVLSGSGDLALKGPFSSKEKVDVDLSGSGNITGNLSGPSVEVGISGSGNVQLKGSTKDFELHTSGSGDFDGGDLLSENALVKISGSGNAKVHASVRLETNISGSGDVRYKGSPQIDSRIHGSGSVKKAD